MITTGLDPVLLPIQGVLSLTFAEEAAKPSKDKESMYSSRPEIEVPVLCSMCT